MNSLEDRKRQAAVRKAARVKRIRTIRSGIAATGVSLVIAFSTVVAQRQASDTGSASTGTTSAASDSSTVAQVTTTDTSTDSGSTLVAEPSSAASQPEALTTSQS